MFCCFYTPKKNNLLIINRTHELRLNKSFYHDCPICMDTNKDHLIFQCKCCKKIICGECTKHIVQLKGSKAMCPMCCTQPICDKLSIHRDTLTQTGELITTITI